MGGNHVHTRLCQTALQLARPITPVHNPASDKGPTVTQSPQ